MARQFFRTIAYVDPQAMDHGTKVRVTLQSETVASVLATAWIAMVGAFNVAVLAFSAAPRNSGIWWSRL
jgi:hypothetical protein